MFSALLRPVQIYISHTSLYSSNIVLRVFYLYNICIVLFLLSDFHSKSTYKLKRSWMHSPKGRMHDLQKDCILMLLILISLRSFLIDPLLNFLSISGNMCVFCFQINLHRRTKTEFKSGLGIPAELFYLRAWKQRSYQSTWILSSINCKGSKWLLTALNGSWIQQKLLFFCS